MYPFRTSVTFGYSSFGKIPKLDDLRSVEWLATLYDGHKVASYRICRQRQYVACQLFPRQVGLLLADLHPRAGDIPSMHQPKHQFGDSIAPSGDLCDRCVLWHLDVDLN